MPPRHVASSRRRGGVAEAGGGPPVQVKKRHPDSLLTLYANGSGGLLERMKTTGVTLSSLRPP
eukprot:5865174-Pyramimonas_sp.AAC.1